MKGKLIYLIAISLQILLFIILFHDLLYDLNFSKQILFKGLYFLLPFNACYYALMLLSNKLDDKYLKRHKTLRELSKTSNIKHINTTLILLIMTSGIIILFNLDSYLIIKLVFYIVNICFYTYLIYLQKFKLYKQL